MRYAQGSSSFEPISVIVPVHNGASCLRKCLSSLRGTVPGPMEIIVVQDGGALDYSTIAESYGAHLIKITNRRGPAYARNLGAKKARGEILLFIDADVTVPSNTMRLVVDGLALNPDCAALFGSYDDEPFETNFLSQYKNLFHHYVHQNANPDASTFWAGCGAVVRHVFLQLGGFAETFSRPCIEDIELGYRIREAGHVIRLSKELQVKHLKHWGVVSLLRTDFFCRALPWAKLILQRGGFVDDLNIKVAERLSVVAAHTSLLTLCAALFSPFFLCGSVLSVAALFWLNRGLCRFFLNKRGMGFTLRAVLWHWLYFFYSGIAFSLALARFGATRLRGSAKRAP